MQKERKFQYFIIAEAFQKIIKSFSGALRFGSFSKTFVNKIAQKERKIQYFIVSKASKI